MRNEDEGDGEVAELRHRPFIQPGFVLHGEASGGLDRPLLTRMADLLQRYDVNDHAANTIILPSNSVASAGRRRGSSPAASVTPAFPDGLLGVQGGPEALGERGGLALSPEVGE